MDDEPVQATNNDASECKRCAVSLGYWQDNYISLFIKSTERRTPEINRGYFARVKGVEMFIHKFIKKAGLNSQIINLGSGFDTLYWRLKDSGIQLSSFIELDFPSITARKCFAIKRHKTLLEKVYDQDGEVKFSSTDLHSENYHLIGVDLRNLIDVEAKLQFSGIDYSLPTLFIAECVLVYIESDCSRKLLSWIADKFKSALFINYEMVNLNDNFASVMLDNLRARGCSMSGVSSCQSIEAQTERFKSTNWTNAIGWDMVQIYHALPTAERHRIEKIEFLDEQELLTQLFQHYCICIAWQGTEFANLDIT